MYEQGNRPELAAAGEGGGRRDRVLPAQQMDEAETKAAIEAAIAETGAASMKDMGKVVGAPARQICRPDGFRQGERAREGAAAEGVSDRVSVARSSRYTFL